MRNFLRKLTRFDVDRADDLAQETFLKLYMSMGTYRSTAKFSTWLYRIAYNTFLNDQRKRVPEMEFEEHHAAPTADTAVSLTSHADVESALRQLTAREQAVFDFQYKKGMTHREIADALELPLGTLKSDLNRGREKLRELLTGQEEH